MGDFMFESLLVGLLTAIVLILMLIAKFIFDLPTNDQWNSNTLYLELRSMKKEMRSLLELVTQELRDIKDDTKQLCDLNQALFDEKQEAEFRRLRVDQLHQEISKEVGDK